MKAVGVNIIVAPRKVEKTEGGIFVPFASQNGADDVQEGVVVSVGDGTFIGGTVTMNLKEGEIVFYRASKGMPINKDGEQYKLITLSDILFKNNPH